MDLGSSIFFGGLIFHNLFEVLRKGDFESTFVMLIEPVVLQSVESNGGLKDVFKIDKA